MPCFRRAVSESPELKSASAARIRFNCVASLQSNVSFSICESCCRVLPSSKIGPSALTLSIIFLQSPSSSVAVSAGATAFQDLFEVCQVHE